MRFHETKVPGLIEVLTAPAGDARGRFLRTWCADEFAAAGIDFRPRQTSISENRARHTLRGMHWQAAPAVCGQRIRARSTVRS